jgi:beta-1,4-mannosyl-glycoprotein beta-1,4-N-acetylglucosaminyltransferase
MASIQWSNINVGRAITAIVAFIIIFKLFLSSGPASSRVRGTSWHGSWRLKLPSWAKPDVPQDRLGFMPMGFEVEEICLRYRWQPFRDRYHRRKIYDLIVINHEAEIDTLLLRMAEMDQVDYFIIVESEFTTKGEEKPLWVSDNYALFSKHHSKMLLHTFNHTQAQGAFAVGPYGEPLPPVAGTDAASLESLSPEDTIRNSLLNQALPLAEDEMIPTHNDVLIHGEVDELIRPEVLTALRNCEIPRRVKLWTRHYYYSFQWLYPDDHANWAHPDVTYFNGWINTLTPTEMRAGNLEGGAMDDSAEIYAAGWRCQLCVTRLGDLVTAAAEEGGDEAVWANPRRILQRVRYGSELFERVYLHRIDNNKDVPGYVVRHPERYGYLLDRDPDDGNFGDAWELIQTLGDKESKGAGGGFGLDSGLGKGEGEAKVPEY